jgi:parvulin-like peptidyl-prolyl isomerase
MLPCASLSTQLKAAIGVCASKPLAELLLQQGWLRQQARDHLLDQLRAEACFDPEDESRLLEQLWHGLAAPRPERLSLSGDWISSQPEELQPQLRQRWDWLRLQKAMEERYGDQVESHFLDRRADLERLVYGVIRVRHQGLADELYLRLLDDDADFGQLARQHSMGDERFTYGLVGPMPVHRLNPALRQVLHSLSIGQIHPPFALQGWVLLLRLDHREPARLDDPTRQLLLEELLQQELEATLDQELTTLYPQLLSGHG